LDGDQEWNDELLWRIVNRFNNVYYVLVCDDNDVVDDEMHGLIK